MSEEGKQQDQEEEQPAQKKLKSVHADLKIVVGGGGGAATGSSEEEGGGGGGSMMKTFRYPTAIMANHSEFIDTKLANWSNNNDGDGIVGEISFPDIDPAVWVKMIGFLEDPVKARNMTVQDALEVVQFYTQYIFPKGCALCSDVMVIYLVTADDSTTPDLDLCIDMIVAAKNHNLVEVYNAAVEYFVGKFERIETRKMFTRNHLVKLASVIAEDESLLRAVGFTVEDVLSSLFPSAFAWKNDLFVAVKRVKLSDTKVNADGDYTIKYSGRASWCQKWFNCPSPNPFVQERFRFKFFMMEGVTENNDGKDWEIVGVNDAEEKVILWRAPNSAHQPLPPQTGWVAVDELAIGDPTVKYRYK